ncbi:oligosaccharide flippase family protein [Nocardioides sp. YIM 152588]|uniref:lipopolysaccharide biosynthesis protein n=1 Tax=Nocardioides sp. YIM 152588 TaxID=3158259 RepID=UPI0032E4AAAF
MTAAPTTAGHRTQLEKLARRGSASVMGAAFSAVFGVLLVVAITNGFSATTAGTLFSATSVFLILESVALLGTDAGLVKWLPAKRASDRSADLPRTLAVAIAPVLVLSVALGVALFVLAPTLAPHLVGGPAEQTMATMLRALAPLLPVAAVFDVVLAATRGAGSMRPTVLVDNIGRLGLQTLAVVAVFLAGGGALALALAWSVPYLVGLAIAGVWLARQMAARPAGGEPAAWSAVAGQFWSFTAPRAIARVTQTALKRADIVLVAALASPAEAALYTAATRFIVIGQLFVQSVQQALSPHVSGLFARSEGRAANAVFQAATLWSVIAAWPLYLTLAGFSPILMGLFGDGYDAGSDVVLVLSLTMLLATACGPVDSVLLMGGHSWLSLRNAVVALVVNLGLDVLLIPVAGIHGAAIAWSIAIVVRNLQPLFQVRRHLDMWPITGSTVRVGLLAVGLFGPVSLAALVLDLSLAVELVLLGLASLGYAAGIWVNRYRLDLGVFRGVLRRQQRPRPGKHARRRGDRHDDGRGARPRVSPPAGQPGSA